MLTFTRYLEADMSPSVARRRLRVHHDRIAQDEPDHGPRDHTRSHEPTTNIGRRRNRQSFVTATESPAGGDQGPPENLNGDRHAQLTD